MRSYTHILCLLTLASTGCIGDDPLGWTDLTPGDVGDDDDDTTGDDDDDDVGPTTDVDVISGDVACKEMTAVSATGLVASSGDGQDCQCTFDAISRTAYVTSIQVENRGSSVHNGYLEFGTKNSGSARNWVGSSSSTGPHRNSLVGEYDLGGSWTYTAAKKARGGSTPIDCADVTDVRLRVTTASSARSAGASPDGEIEEEGAWCQEDAAMDVQVVASPLGLLTRPLSPGARPLGTAVTSIELVDAGLASSVSVRLGEQEFVLDGASPMAPVVGPTDDLRLAVTAGAPEGPMPILRLHTSCSNEAPQPVAQGYRIDGGMLGLTEGETAVARIRQVDDTPMLFVGLVGFPANRYGLPLFEVAPGTYTVDIDDPALRLAGTLMVQPDALSFDVADARLQNQELGPMQLVMPTYP